jgi:uncharacterized protein (TIGR02145 family)
VLSAFLLSSNFINAQKEVIIGNQTWMSENLDVKNFKNGDAILQAQTNDEWEKAGFDQIPAWCYYEMESKNIKTYGILYNRFALYDPRGLAPNGWRLPNDNDWEALITFLGGSTLAGAELKSATAWNETIKLEDRYKFNALPGGWRDVGFGGLNNSCYWWSVNANSLEEQTRYYDLSKGINDLMSYSTSWIMGYYVRCVKE